MPCPAGVHLSISMILKSVIYFPFSCPIPFFFKTLIFSIPFPSILSLFSTLLSPCSPTSDSSIFFTLHDLLHFFHLIKSSACQGTNCGSCMHRKSMLPVTSDAHTFLSIMPGMCSNCQFSWLTQIHPMINNTFLYIGSYFA